jgi:ribose transport system permease protein
MKKKIPQQTIILVGIIVVLLLLGSMINHQFVASMNVANILTMSALLGFIAIGQTLVVLSGDNGLDLSVGGVMSLGAILATTYMSGQNKNFLPAMLIVLVSGAIFGFLNSIGIVYAKVPAMVMTLAMANVLTSIQQIFTGGYPKGAPSPIASAITTTRLIPFLPGIVVLWIVMIGIVHLVLTRSSYGKQLYAMGANKNAALLTGVKIRKIKIITYTLCGMMSAFTGFWLCAYNGVVYVNAGSSYIMPSVAVVVIGGTSLAGGKGSYSGTVAGAVILTIINSLLVMVNTDEAGRFILNGFLLIILLAIYTRQPKNRQ